MPRFGYFYCKTATVMESIPYFFWKEIRRLPYSFIQSAFEKMSKRGGQRIFGDARIHHIIQFIGYVEQMIGNAVPVKLAQYVAQTVKLAPFHLH